MKIRETRRAKCVSMLAIASALALGATGCGGDDNGDDGGADASTSSASADRDRVTAAIRRTGSLLEKRDASGVCAAMTGEGRRYIAATETSFLSTPAAKPAARPTCESTLKVMLSGNVIEDLDPRIVAVDFERNRAFVTADVSHDDVTDQVAVLAKENGEWKLSRWFTEAKRLGSAGPAPSSGR